MRRTVFHVAIASTVLALAVSPTLTRAQPKPAPKPASAPAAKPPADPLKSLSSKRDDMRGITWYRHPTSPKYINSNGFFLYFGKEDNGSFGELRLVARYYADDWLFITRAWAKADGVTIDVPQESNRLFGWERDHSDGKIYEWTDTALTSPKDIAAVRKLAEAKSVTVRFEGKQYYNDRSLSSQQLKALRDVIAAYETATGKPWK